MSSGKPKVVPVSELFDRLVAEYRSGNVPHSTLFQTALRVCADDSKRVQRGEPPAQIRELVQRARATLDVSHPGSSPPAPNGWPAAPVDAAPIRFAGRQAPFAPEPPLDGPPTEAAGLTPETPDPTPLSSVSEFEFTPEAPARSIPDEVAPVPPPPLVPPLPAPLEAEPPEEALPVGPADVPFEAHPEPISPILTLNESRVSFEDLFNQEADARLEDAQTDGGGAPSLVFRIGVIALALLAGAVVIVVLWPGIAPRKSGPSRIIESFPAPQPTAAPPPLAALLVPTPAPAALPTATPVPEPTQRPPEPTAPSRPATAARPAVVEGVETMRSPDWTGHPPTFVVHFASYHSRENATADAARLGRETGRSAHALQVDLGEKGTWYRVVVGDFATAEEARAFHAEIAARKPGEVGGVYRLSAP
ncbi:MAG: SPOR domain-containing protein [Thermoanaerobaculaceae bacterium]